jgi:excisionase family DNA binding protein
MNKTEAPALMLNVREAAQRIGVSSSWIYNRIYEKTMPFPYHLIGHRYVIKAADIDRFLQVSIHVPRGVRQEVPMKK